MASSAAEPKEKKKSKHRGKLKLSISIWFDFSPALLSEFLRCLKDYSKLLVAVRYLPLKKKPKENLNISKFKIIGIQN